MTQARGPVLEARRSGNRGSPLMLPLLCRDGPRSHSWSVRRPCRQFPTVVLCRTGMPRTGATRTLWH